MEFISKLSSFFNWPKGKELNISTLGEYLKQSWFSILLLVLVIFAVLYLIKIIISAFKDLLN